MTFFPSQRLLKHTILGISGALVSNFCEDSLSRDKGSFVHHRVIGRITKERERELSRGRKITALDLHKAEVFFISVQYAALRLGIARVPRPLSASGCLQVTSPKCLPQVQAEVL